MEWQDDLVDAEHDPTIVLKARHDSWKEQSIRGDDRPSIRKSLGRTMNTGLAEKIDRNATDQSHRVKSPGIWRRVALKESTQTSRRRTKSHYTSRSRFGCGQAGHYKKSCPYREYGDAAVRS